MFEPRLENNEPTIELVKHIVTAETLKAALHNWFGVNVTIIYDHAVDTDYYYQLNFVQDKRKLSMKIKREACIFAYGWLRGRTSN